MIKKSESWKNGLTSKINSLYDDSFKQAGAELGQAQPYLGLKFRQAILTAALICIVV